MLLPSHVLMSLPSRLPDTDNATAIASSRICLRFAHTHTIPPVAAEHDGPSWRHSPTIPSRKTSTRPALSLYSPGNNATEMKNKLLLSVTQSVRLPLCQPLLFPD
ncbi:hypothetical protein XELAEV_18005001mg [Xenopus laevis]|uniref:Uncharacterized protein n=1 Tax=Xenopus laevis TaxID=8355 RepID=A0A974I2H7_XENLA|nr:hypothetical protein XELAEV_18005001mg [Xenopus laevis]